MNGQQAPDSWTGTEARLVITWEGRSPEPVAEAVPLTPTSAPALARRTSGGIWALTVHERRFGGLEGKLDELLRRVTPYAEGLASLRGRGYDVCVEVFGFVGDGSTATLAPEVVARTAALGLPLVALVSDSAR